MRLRTRIFELDIQIIGISPMSVCPCFYLPCAEMSFFQEHKSAIGAILGIFFALMVLLLGIIALAIIIVLKKRHQKKKGQYTQELSEKVNIYGIHRRFHVKILTTVPHYNVGLSREEKISIES